MKYNYTDQGGQSCSPVREQVPPQSSYGKKNPVMN